MRRIRGLARSIAAVVAITAAGVFESAHGNHYILPCDGECRDASEIPIGPGMTGTWVDPAQSGHGFAIQVLPGQPLEMLVRWYVFDQQGGQTWIAARGPITGTRAVLQAYQIVGGGGRFPPNFDPANVHEQAWGTLTLSFSDCSNALVEWVATAPGYGSGALDLVRLTTPAGLVCRDESGGAARGAGGSPP